MQSTKQDESGIVDTILKHTNAMFPSMKVQITSHSTKGNFLLANHTETQLHEDTVPAVNLAAQLGISNDNLATIDGRDKEIFGVGDFMEGLSIRKVTGMDLIDASVKGYQAGASYVEAINLNGSPRNVRVSARPQS
jgi:hypothetical protein